MLSIHDIQLKYDFRYYVQERLHIPFQDTKYIITDSHLAAIQTVQDNRFTVVKGYRGWGKSELFSFCYTMWRAEMWNESAMILSANEDLAYQKLDMIRYSVEADNEQLRWMSGKGNSSIIWNRGEIWLIDSRNKTIGEDGKPIYKIKAKIYAKGIFSSFRGIHVHNIIGDDIVVEDNSLTAEQRDQLERRFFAAALGMRLNNDQTHVVVIGTPQNDDDLLQKLCHRDNKQWAKVIVPVYNNMGAPYCPELHNEKWILEQRSMVGEAIFQQEYMLSPVKITNDFFGKDLIEASYDRSSSMLFEYKKNPKEMVAIGVDFSIIEDRSQAEKNDNDYFAITAICYDTDTGERKILNMYRDRGVSKMKQLSMVKLWCMKYDANALGLEMHAFLSWAKQDLENSIAAKIVDTGSRRGKLDKSEGLPSMQYVFEKRLYKIPYADDYSKSLVNAVTSELTNLKTSPHDDLADSLLRAEQVVKSWETQIVEYDNEFDLYGENRKITRNSADRNKRGNQESWIWG